MSSPLVSICVPVYNVAPYIERCVRSLMEQDYDNLEYIFVNDGSTDDSVQRLASAIGKYPERQARVHIFHNDRNRGSAYTRRMLVEKAQGEYISYVDADDWVDRCFISSLVNQACVEEADVVVAPMKEYVGNKVSEIRDVFKYDKLFDNCIYDFVGHLCGKLIRREMIVMHACFAPEGMNYLEDRLILLKISCYTQRVSQTDEVYYHYVHQSSSITAIKDSVHFDCLILYWQEAEQLMKERGVWVQYKDGCRKVQVEDKIALMLQCRSMATRKKYADLYREDELVGLKGLLPGFKLMGVLVHYHLWGLIRLYQIYIDWLSKRKNR